MNKTHGLGHGGTPGRAAHETQGCDSVGDDVPCSKCGAALDTGLECTECGYDMAPEMRAWLVTSQPNPDIHPRHARIMELAGVMGEQFEIHHGAGTWTDPAYRQDARTWGLAWRTATAHAMRVQPPSPQQQGAEPVAEASDFYRWVRRAYRDADEPGRTFTIDNMHVAYVGGENRNELRHVQRAAQASPTPAQAGPKPEQLAALDAMAANAEELGLYDKPAGAQERLSEGRIDEIAAEHVMVQKNGEHRDFARAIESAIRDWAAGKEGR